MEYHLYVIEELKPYTFAKKPDPLRSFLTEVFKKCSRIEKLEIYSSTFCSLAYDTLNDVASDELTFQDAIPYDDQSMWGFPLLFPEM